MTTANFEFDELAAAQSQPEVLINRTSWKIDALLLKAAIAFTDAPPGSPQAGDVYIVGTGTGAFAGLDNRIVYYSGGWISVPPWDGALFYVASENDHYRYEGTLGWVVFTPGGVSGTDLGLYFPGGPPSSNQLMFKFVAGRDLEIPADFAGSLGHVGTNPTSSFQMAVSVNGSGVGTITVSTGGVFTFSTSGVAVPVDAGERIEIAAPASTDATIADIALTLIADVAAVGA